MIFVILVILVIILWFALTYNTFVNLNNRTDEAWADISVQLKRRYDLIPNLVEAVKAYQKHESQIFQDISEARSKALSAQTVSDKESADNLVTQALSKIIAISENYPNLKASDNFINLQTNLSQTEDVIASSRRFYNGNVRDLNTMIETLPSNLIATIFHFSKRTFFQVDQEETNNPKLSFKSSE